MFIFFNNNKFSYSNIMSTTENIELILQYMRLVLRQQEGLINTMNSMQRQNDNLYRLISETLRHNSEDIPRNRVSISRPRRSATRPRTRMFFPSSLSGINERSFRNTPRVVTHRNGNMTVNLPGSVTQSTTTEDIINESFNSYTPISIRPSLHQIRRATRILEFRDISNSSQHICPIDREILNPSDSVMQILHCNHVFRESNLRRHFRNNTRCPLCRYDIRDYIPSLGETTPLLSRRPTIPPPPPPPGPPLRRRPTMIPPPPPSVPPPASTLFDDFSFEDIENPFETRPSLNINPSQSRTQEIESLLGRAIDNVINSDPSGNNVLAFEYSVSIGSNRDTNA